MRNLYYSIVCYLRRKFRFREGSICEAIYEWADQQKAHLDKLLYDKIFHHHDE